jgi:hypothetical protein
VKEVKTFKFWKTSKPGPEKSQGAWHWSLASRFEKSTLLVLGALVALVLVVSANLSADRINATWLEATQTSESLTLKTQDQLGNLAKGLASLEAANSKPNALREFLNNRYLKQKKTIKRLRSGLSPLLEQQRNDAKSAKLAQLEPRARDALIVALTMSCSYEGELLFPNVVKKISQGYGGNADDTPFWEFRMTPFMGYGTPEDWRIYYADGIWLVKTIDSDNVWVRDFNCLDEIIMED